MKKLSLAPWAAASLGLLSGAAMADASLLSALTEGSISLDARLRSEYVEQSSFSKDALATTLRMAPGYSSKSWQGFDARLELEGVIAANGNLYNSTGNGTSNRPVVPDPETFGLNQGWLRYTGPGKLAATLGRQRLIFDSARFLGNVGWRQDEQTYDGLLLEAPIGKAFSARAAHIGSVNSFRRYGSNLIAACAVSGPCSADLSLNGNLLNLAYVHGPALRLVGYGYWLDFSADTAARRDTRTLGLRASGSHALGESQHGWAISYTLEAAEQQGIDDAPDSVDASYRLLELGVQRAGIQAKLGVERLGGNGSYGFQTPLATLHAFNGWADVFLATPANGLQDQYAQLSGSIRKLGLVAAYHRYRADVGSATYGKELDLQASLPLAKTLNAGVKAAFYNADTFPAAAGQAVDITKVWLWVQYKLQ